MSVDLARRAASEALGTAFLLAAIVGSGIMADRLSAGNAAVALLANSLATGGALLAIILTLQSVSAHLNPVVTLVEAWAARLPWRDVAVLVVAQLAGAVCGVLAAHAMFSEPWVSVSEHDRGGVALMLSELIATFGLVGVILGCARTPVQVPFAVSAYIVAAYWFTASTSFANPAVTVARGLTRTFAGIRGADVPGFILAQLAGAAAAALIFSWMLRPTPPGSGAHDASS